MIVKLKQSLITLILYKISGQLIFILFQLFQRVFMHFKVYFHTSIKYIFIVSENQTYTYNFTPCGCGASCCKKKWLFLLLPNLYTRLHFSLSKKIVLSSLFLLSPLLILSLPSPLLLPLPPLLSPLVSSLSSLRHTFLFYPIHPQYVIKLPVIVRHRLFYLRVEFFL